MQQRMIQVHVLISGTVQNVAYRVNARKQAIALQVRGWVRNLPDGRVEAVFHGAQHNVDAMVNWCRRGPLKAAVSEVAVTRQGLEAFSAFSVKGDAPAVADPAHGGPDEA